MINAIIFDADGVLINGELFSTHLEREYGITAETTRPFFTGVFVDCVTGKKELADVLPPYLKEWGWNGSVKDFIDYWHRSEHVIDTELVDYIQALRKKGIICALATNQTRNRFDYMMNEMGFRNFFDKLYASAHLGYRKPDSEFYERMIADLGIADPGEIVFWDDTPRNVEAAQRSGIRAYVYTTFPKFWETVEQLL